MQLACGDTVPCAVGISCWRGTPEATPGCWKTIPWRPTSIRGLLDESVIFKFHLWHGIMEWVQFYKATTHDSNISSESYDYYTCVAFMKNMLQGQSPSNFKLAISNLLSQNNQPNNVSMPAKSSPIYCEWSALFTQHHSQQIVLRIWHFPRWGKTVLQELQNSGLH